MTGPLSRVRADRLAGAVGALIILAALAAPAAAQDEAALRAFFSGKRVTVRIDMPAGTEGVDVSASRALDVREHAERVKTLGVALHAGDSAVVSDVSVKGNAVEFRLAGGSRFNVRYDGAVPARLTPADLVDALSEYVDFYSAGFLPASPERLLDRNVPPR